MNASMIAQPRTPHHRKTLSNADRSDSAPGQIKGHRRTTSKIPQFDRDADSVGSLGLDDTIEVEVVETLRHLVDLICADEEQKDKPQAINESNEEDEEGKY
jgi:hypothetical protein